PREIVARPVHPPDVVASGVDQLELQVVVRRIATQLERVAVVARVLDHQVALDAGMAGNSVEIVVQAQRAALLARDRAQAAADLVGGHHAPLRGILETVEQARRLWGYPDVRGWLCTCAGR